MESTIFERLRGSLSDRRQSLLQWLNQAPGQSRATIVGPVGENILDDRIRHLDAAIEKAEKHTLGLCEVCNDYIEASRLEMDYTACICIDHLTGEEKKRLENDLELSQKVQKALLPEHVPSIPGLSISAFSQPASIVGGDYFDFLRYENGMHGFVIADVMGKGMAASLLMASFQASLRILAPENSDPGFVASRLNDIFCNNIRLTKFVTVFLAQLDEHSRNLSFCNAGHNPPMLARVDGRIEFLRPTGAAIGLVEQARFLTETISLEPGDKLLAFTDGVVELPNKSSEMFGEDRLAGFLRESRGLAPQQLLSSLREKLQGFSGLKTPVDDTTVIVMGVE